MESHEDNAKKPIYKKWWFWAIIIVLIIIIGTGNFSNDDQLASANTYQTNNSVEVIVVLVEFVPLLILQGQIDT